MTRAPWLLQNGRSGYRMGMPSRPRSSTPWCSTASGAPSAAPTWASPAEILSERFGISKEEQNEVAFNSQAKAAAAIKAGRFKDEIVPV